MLLYATASLDEAKSMQTSLMSSMKCMYVHETYAIFDGLATLDMELNIKRAY